MLEEYRPIIKFIVSPDNYAEDALSRMPLIRYNFIERKITGGEVIWEL